MNPKWIIEHYLNKQPKKFKPMIVCLAGPSGSGKTTLAKELAKYFGWAFTEQSAGLIADKDSKEYMAENFNYTGSLGQCGVINKSHSEPEFGAYFQCNVLDNRNRLLKGMVDKGMNAVLDRSPLDPIVFYLNQVVHNEEQDVSELFIHRCISALRNVDMIIRVPLQNPNREIENNGSRVTNYWFQRKIDGLFDQALNIVHAESQLNSDLFGTHRICIHRVPCWNWEDRVKDSIEAISKFRLDHYK